MISLYAHQAEGIRFLAERNSAMLTLEMGLGKTRCALVAAQQLFEKRKIDRVLVLLPAAVAFSWREELSKLGLDGFNYNLLRYEPKKQLFVVESVGGNLDGPKRLPIALVSYSLLPQERHVKAITKWCFEWNAVLIADESSFLKNRTAKQTKGSHKIGAACQYRWLLTGTPIANSPLDLYGQGLVMANGNGPLKSFKNYWVFRARYAVTQPMRFGGRSFQQVTGYQNLDELTKRFAPYVLRREKKDCLDLPEKSYTVREVALDESTWKIYQELKREAMLCLPDSEAKPEPNAAVRILRLCQLTSGHVGATPVSYDEETNTITSAGRTQDVSSEKLTWLCNEILDGELANEKHLLTWCRWRRERERLAEMLRKEHEFVVLEIFGGQSQLQRDTAIGTFGTTSARSILIGQPKAGGYGLNLTTTSTAVYLSNTFSHIDREQSSDRIHRIGQTKPCLYVDVLAVGPKGQRTVDHHILDCLKCKRDLATLTCQAWRAVLGAE